MIDHVYISASDPARTVAFYAAALKPLGWREFASYDSATGPEGVPDLWGLIDGSGANTIWIRQRQPGETGLYIGFVANDPAEASAAYAAALEAGGRDDGSRRRDRISARATTRPTSSTSTTTASSSSTRAGTSDGTDKPAARCRGGLELAANTTSGACEHRTNSQAKLKIAAVLLQGLPNLDWVSLTGARKAR